MNIIFRLWETIFPKEKVFPIHMNPYRTAEIMPEEKPEPEPKKKREFKMDIKLGKHAKTFGYVMPICASLIGMGLLYDTSLLGYGFKWGAGLALVVMVIFFFFMTIDQTSRNEDAGD